MALTKNIITTFGVRLRALREDSHLSLRAVAFEIGIDTSLLGKIERNERQPTKEQLKLFATFFKLDEKQLSKEVLSDQIAYKIFDQDADLDTLKVAEKKVQYLKANKINNDNNYNRR